MRDQVSLEWAKKLQAAGWKGECERNYCGGHTWYEDDDEGVFKPCDETELIGEDNYCESASLTAENLIPAPSGIQLLEGLKHSWFAIDTNGEIWRLYRTDLKIEIDNAFLPDAAAAMTVYLLEQGLI